jgi:hypothetical protein
MVGSPQSQTCKPFHRFNRSSSPPTTTQLLAGLDEEYETEGFDASRHTLLNLKSDVLGMFTPSLAQPGNALHSSQAVRFGLPFRLDTLRRWHDR